MCIATACFLGCDVINFEINPISLIRPFFYITKMSRQKFKYLQNEKSFYGEIKKHFLLFLKGLQFSQALERVVNGNTNFISYWI